MNNPYVCFFEEVGYKRCLSAILQRLGGITLSDWAKDPSGVILSSFQMIGFRSFPISIIGGVTDTWTITCTSIPLACWWSGTSCSPSLCPCYRNLLYTWDVLQGRNVWTVDTFWPFSILQVWLIFRMVSWMSVLGLLCCDSLLLFSLFACFDGPGAILSHHRVRRLCVLLFRSQDASKCLRGTCQAFCRRPSWHGPLRLLCLS